MWQMGTEQGRRWARSHCPVTSPVLSAATASPSSLPDLCVNTFGDVIEKITMTIFFSEIHHSPIVL